MRSSSRCGKTLWRTTFM